MIGEVGGMAATRFVLRNPTSSSCFFIHEFPSRTITPKSHHLKNGDMICKPYKHSVTVDVLQKQCGKMIQIMVSHMFFYILGCLHSQQ